MFLNRRKRFNGKVADLLVGFGIDVRVAPMAFLQLLDEAWLMRYSVEEATLMICTARAAKLYDKDFAEADRFVMTQVYPAQLQWMQVGRVRLEVAEPMVRLIKSRACKAYDAHSDSGSNLPRDESGTTTGPSNAGGALNPRSAATGTVTSTRRAWGDTEDVDKMLAARGFVRRGQRE